MFLAKVKSSFFQIHGDIFFLKATFRSKIFFNFFLNVTKKFFNCYLAKKEKNYYYYLQQ